MENIYSKIVELCEKDRFSVLATIIKQAGSTPRGVGTKFLILEDGSFVDSSIVRTVGNSYPRDVLQHCTIKAGLRIGGVLENTEDLNPFLTSY